MSIRQISVFVENKQGRLAEITEILAGAGINLRAVSIADTSDFGILRLIVDKPDAAEKALKDAGLTMSVTPVLALSLDDTPGSFAGAVRILADNDISIEYMYAFNTGLGGKASIIVRVNDNEQAVKALAGSKISIIAEQDIV